MARSGPNGRDLRIKQSKSAAPAFPAAIAGGRGLSSGDAEERLAELGAEEAISAIFRALGSAVEHIHLPSSAQSLWPGRDPEGAGTPPGKSRYGSHRTMRTQ